MTAAEVQEVFALGKKAWGRSKIMIVGEGRAGKTALSNSIIGKAFTETDSTVGINGLTCDIKYATTNLIKDDREEGEGGSWSEYIKPIKELEAALAKMIVDKKKNIKRKAEVSNSYFDENNTALKPQVLDGSVICDDENDNKKSKLTLEYGEKEKNTSIINSEENNSTDSKYGSAGKDAVNSKMRQHKPENIEQLKDSSSHIESINT